MDILFYIIAGAGVGFAVGLTGVGGGSLMTPLLIFSGVPEKIAIGTDLLYAAITKTGGAWSHKKLGTIKWKLVILLAAGSIPSSLITAYGLYLYGEQDYSHILSTSLGVMLILTAVVLLLKGRLRQKRTEDATHINNHWYHRHANGLTIFAGVCLGVLVTLSSVGAGAFCAMLLFTLYPRLPALHVVGTDIAHAVPLTFIGGLAHFFLLGNVDWGLLAGLLIGSLPAVHFGAKLAVKIPNSVLQPILATLLLIIGLKFLFF